MKAIALGAVSGALFGVGLAISGMTQPAKVLGFLDVTGPWDASLAFVMGGAVAVYALAYRLIRRRSGPLFDAEFHVPASKTIDPPLLVGAALFGIGWGLGGFCPGPALVSLGAAAPNAAWFVLAMTAGMLLQRFTAPKPKTDIESAREAG